MEAYAGLFLVAVVVMVVLLIVGHGVAAVTGRVEGRDERDRLIAWKAEHRSGWVTAAGALGAVACLAAGVDGVWAANLLLVSLALAHVLSFSLQIVYYRRGV